MYHISKINTNEESCDFDDSFGFQNAFDRLNIVTNRSLNTFQDACDGFDTVTGRMDDIGFNQMSQLKKSKDNVSHLLSKDNKFNSYLSNYKSHFCKNDDFSNFHHSDYRKTMEISDHSTFYDNNTFSHRTLNYKNFKDQNYSFPRNFNSENFIKNDHRMINKQIDDTQLPNKNYSLPSKNELKLTPIDRDNKNFIDFSKKTCLNEKIDFKNEAQTERKKMKKSNCSSSSKEESLSDSESSKTILSNRLSILDRKENELMNHSHSAILTLSCMKNNEKAKDASKFKQKIARLQDEMKKIKKKRECLQEKEKEIKSSYIKLTIKMKQRGLRPGKNIFNEVTGDEMVLLESKAIETLTRMMDERSDE